MANQHPTNAADSSRYPRASQPFKPKSFTQAVDELEYVEAFRQASEAGHEPEAAFDGEYDEARQEVRSRGGAAAMPEAVDGGAYAYGGGSNEGERATFDTMDRYQTSTVSFTAPRRQPRANDDVHYTTSPFEKPRDAADRRAEAIDPEEKRGLVSRAAGTMLLIGAALFGVAAVVLTVLMQVYISVPLFLVALGLFYAGRGSLRDSAERIHDPVDADPGRNRQPDISD